MSDVSMGYRCRVLLLLLDVPSKGVPSKNIVRVVVVAVIRNKSGLPVVVLILE